VEADTPEAAASILLSDVTDRDAVDEVWVTRHDRTWVYGRDGMLLRGGTTGDVERADASHAADDRDGV
jgi:hypothetical protein